MSASRAFRFLDEEAPLGAVLLVSEQPRYVVPPAPRPEWLREQDAFDLRMGFDHVEVTR